MSSKPSLSPVYFIHLICPPGTSWLSVWESFSVTHAILNMGTKGYLGILLKLYPGPSVVLEVRGPVLAELISLKYAPNVACF